MARNYVNNRAFYDAMVEYKKACNEAEEAGDEHPIIPNYIGECIYNIARKLSYKHNFINYTFREDMVADGMENAIMAVKNFDPEKSTNPFAYFTQVIWFAFLRRIEKERKQLYIKHKVIENSVLTGTSSESSEHSSEGSAAYIDLDTDYMNDFVSNYENTMETRKQKKLESQKKRGLDKFYEEDKD